MSLQLILGPSGAGKSQYMYERIIKESIEHPEINYILLVPEQYSMALQRKMVMLHPGMGTMNIDVIGFNRLAYRIFDELNIKPAKVLEDFGKSMLVRQVAGCVSQELSMYKNCLNKPGFIDEVKALMSELFQYDVSREKLNRVIQLLEKENEQSALFLKLKDMAVVFSAFDERIEKEYIVAEQLIELLNTHISNSELIKKSVIVMDGFTGFTPIQLKLVGTLLSHAIKVYSLHTIDKAAYNKKRVGEHELFYLSSKTIESVKELAISRTVSVEADIFIGTDAPKRWEGDKTDLLHLEKNLFRYPYKKYEGCPENIKAISFYNPRAQIEGIATEIYKLVKEEGFRYKDIAVISGNFESNISNIERIFPIYNIPYFMDYTRPVKNNPYIDSIGHLLRVVEENFSYDSVFSFVKSGVIRDLSDEDIELMENYVLARGIRGVNRWRAVWKEELYVAKEALLDFVMPFYDSIVGKKKSVKDYVQALLDVTERLSYKEAMKDTKGLYDKLLAVFDKLLEIMPEEIVSVREFREILELGLKDMNMGVIPNSIDMVTVGDITRTRLDAVKVLFIMDVNDGIIPSTGSNTRIINDKDKLKLEELGVTLAPTLKANAYIEQFYLYSNMTQPSHKLYISYCTMNSNNQAMAPSYLVSRITGLFPALKIKNMIVDDITTKQASVGRLIDKLSGLKDGHNEEIDSALSLYKLYKDIGEEGLLKKISSGLKYTNIPDNLSEQVADLVKLHMMYQSVSKLEQYAKCGYSYFLKYTIGLKERELNEVMSYDTGNVLHGAMERMYRHVHDNLDNDWSKLGEEEQDKLITDFVNFAWENELKEKDLEEAKYKNLKNTLVRIGKRTVKSLSELTLSEALKPEYFEYRFTEEMSVDDTHRMTLKGIVDRGDLYINPDNNTLYLRIIDYKSGVQKFELNKLYEGLQLQLSMYMNIMLSLVDEQYNKKDNSPSVVPEGMYYYSMNDPFVEITKIEELDKKRKDKLKLEGYAGKDLEEFSLILKYADKKAKDIASDIILGNIAKEPMSDSYRSTCEFCPYSNVCRFDDKYGGNKKRYSRFEATMKDKPNIMSKIKEELEEVGGTYHEN